MFTNVIRLSEPALEPVTLNEVKEQLRLDTSYTMEDGLLSSYIIASRGRCEEYCNRYFAESDFLVLYTQFADDLIIPFPDSVVNSIFYTDQSGDSQEFTAYTYDADFRKIIPDSSFPIGTDVKVEITSGKSYPRANMAIKLYVSDLYEARTAEKSQPNYAAESLLYPLRVNMGV